MGKQQYVYWRQPKGDRPSGNDERNAPTALLSHLGKHESAVEIDRGPFVNLFPGLSRLKLGVQIAVVVVDPDKEELNSPDTWEIASDAIKSILVKRKKRGPIEPSEFRSVANEKASSYFRRREKDYCLVTSLSLSSLPSKRILVNGCMILPLKQRGKKYGYPDSLHLGGDEDPIARHIKRSEYIPIRIKTTGRSVHAATEKALRALNLLRGLWSLFASYGSFSTQLGRRSPRPIGEIHSGPIHTLHRPDGSPAASFYWYEPSYAGDQRIFNAMGEWDRIEGGRRSAQRRLKRHPFRRDVTALLCRYVTALDQPDMGVAFLQLWSIIESITDFANGSHDKTINRAKAIFEDHQLWKGLLQQLCNYRNQYVHSVGSSDDVSDMVYIPKSTVEAHLVRLIRNDCDVESLREYAEFLDLPREVNLLKKRQKWHATAIGFQQRAQKQKGD